MTDRIWNLLGTLLMPRGLWSGPEWLQRLKWWWLAQWGRIFFHTEPWHPFRKEPPQ